MLFHHTPKPVPNAPEGVGESTDLETQVKRRRDRMAGLWAAELLGLIGHAAHDYAREVAHAHDDDDRVVGRLTRDLNGKVTSHEIREKLRHLVGEARRQLLSERKDH